MPAFSTPLSRRPELKGNLFYPDLIVLFGAIYKMKQLPSRIRKRASLYLLVWTLCATWQNGCLDGAVLLRVSFNGKLYPIMDARRMNPIIHSDGKRKTVKQAQYNFRPTGGVPFEEGSYQIRNLQFTTLGSRLADSGNVINRAFDFSAEIKTSVDVKNCYIGIDIKPANFEPGILIYEMPDFKANKWKKVNFRVPISVPLSRGEAKEYLFTHGQQILPETVFKQLKQKSALASAVSSVKRQLDDSPPQVITYFSPGFPDNLKGIVETGSVVLEFVIGIKGMAHSVKVVESTHELLNPLAIEAIEKTKFKPAIKEGMPIETRLRQKINFTDPGE